MLNVDSLLLVAYLYRNILLKIIDVDSHLPLHSRFVHHHFVSARSQMNTGLVSHVSCYKVTAPSWSKNVYIWTCFRGYTHLTCTPDTHTLISTQVLKLPRAVKWGAILHWLMQDATGLCSRVWLSPLLTQNHCLIKETI